MNSGEAMLSTGAIHRIFRKGWVQAVHDPREKLRRSIDVAPEREECSLGRSRFSPRCGEKIQADQHQLMTHDYQWRKAVAWEGEDPPSGFERTLPPSDPRARSGVPLSGYAVRDNRQGQVIRANAVRRAEGATAASGPISVTPVSGVVKSGQRSQSKSIDIADTIRDVPLLPYEEPLEITPDFASEYVPPQPPPRIAQHKTFELRPVRLDPQIHPRTAPTELNLRTVKRRQEKQQKDARELAELVAQAELRRRGPWMFVAFALVVAAGFLVGAELVDSAEAEAEPRLVTPQPPIAHAMREEPVRQQLPAPSEQPLPAPESGAVERKATAVAPERGATRLASTAELAPGSVAPKQPAVSRRESDRQPGARAPSPPKASTRAERDVWLK